RVPGALLAPLAAGDVQPRHTAVPVPDREFGYFRGTGGMPHRRDDLPRTDTVPGVRGTFLPEFQSFLNGFDNLFEGESPLQVLLGGIPGLGVDHTVGRKVLGGLRGRAYQGVP